MYCLSYRLQDTPSAKMTYSAAVRVPQPLTALMSAVPLEGEKGTSDGGFHVWLHFIGFYCIGDGSGYHRMLLHSTSIQCTSGGGGGLRFESLALVHTCHVGS